MQIVLPKLEITVERPRKPCHALEVLPRAHKLYPRSSCSKYSYLTKKIKMQIP